MTFIHFIVCFAINLALHPRKKSLSLKPVVSKVALTIKSTRTPDKLGPSYSPHFTRKSLRVGGGGSALVRCGRNVYWWVDYRAAIGGKQYDASGSYTVTYRLKTSSS
jgi:hypothetical protein